MFIGEALLGVLFAWFVTRRVFLDLLLGLGSGTSLFPTYLATSSEPSLRVHWRSIVECIIRLICYQESFS